ncbi:hypothetical protein MTP99_001442 [Tenebrio molitor]|nr:hypothetical protein MTP99_001442 [Tenebrio molitor]
MKFDSLSFALLQLFYFSNAATCKPRYVEKSTGGSRLCIGIGEDGNLEGKVVTCSGNDLCDDPETYPCATTTLSTPKPISTKAATQVDCDGPKKYLADECNQYYECVEVKLLWFWSFWNPQLKNCPKGEAFDAVNEQCLPQELVQCHSTPVQTSVTTVDNGTPPVTTFMNLEIISEVNTKVSSLTSNDVIVTEGTDTTATDSIYSAEVTTNSREGTSTNIVPNFTGTHTSTSDIHPYSSTMSAVLITGTTNSANLVMNTTVSPSSTSYSTITNTVTSNQNKSVKTSVSLNTATTLHASSTTQSGTSKTSNSSIMPTEISTSHTITSTPKINNVNTVSNAEPITSNGGLSNLVVSSTTTTRKTSSYKEVVTATIKTNTSNETFFSTKPVVGTTTYTLSSLYLTSKDGTSPTISFTDVPIINTTIHTEVVPISITETSASEILVTIPPEAHNKNELGLVDTDTSIAVSSADVTQTSEDYDFSSTIISEISTTVPSTTVSGRTFTTSLNISNKTEALVPSSTVYSEDKTQTTLDSTSTNVPLCNDSERYAAPRCNQYFVCDLKLLGKNAQLMTCPNAQAFNPIEKQCTHAEALNCNETRESTTIGTTVKVVVPLVEIISGTNAVLASTKMLLVAYPFMLSVIR